MRNFVMKNTFSIMFLGLIVMFSIICVVKYGVDESDQYIEVTVNQGDSLWEIADEHNYDNMETAQFVAHLEKVNNIDGNVIKVGDVLRIPVKEEQERYLTMSNN